MFRYSVPTSPYEWRVQDYMSCVGPVKGALAVKGKNHNMLKSKRKFFIKIKRIFFILEDENPALP